MTPTHSWPVRLGLSFVYKGVCLCFVKKFGWMAIFLTFLHDFSNIPIVSRSDSYAYVDWSEYFGYDEVFWMICT